MADGNVLQVVPSKTDVDLAAAHRTKVVEALVPILAILDAAKKDGFDVQFALGPDFMGKTIVQQMTISKKF